MMRTELDMELLGQTVQDLYRFKQGEVMSAVVHLGMRLELFDALADNDGATSEALAEATGLHERWVREWLHAVAAADLAQHEDGAFALTPEAKATLTQPDHPAAVGGVFGPPITHREIDRTAEAFQTGIGMTWDEHGAHTCHFQAAMGAGGQKTWLVPVILDSIEGMTDRLTAGATVVDIGCGAGVAASVIAAAYPASTVIGMDPSGHAIVSAQARADDAGLTNLEFRQGVFDDLAQVDGVDLLLTLDVIHDLPRPGDAVRSARTCLADNGVWFVADIKTRGGLEDNRVIPVLPLMYGMSLLYCMSSAMSEPDGAGLGTLGLTESVFGELTAAAGFGSVDSREFDVDPLNRYYEVRV
ncbi:MAG: methyltransferase domain-containing protein [Acidimicrobiales bacterium]|jgi:2-polyprenyl-3-methyl-5-hydroxy-6-metoxy-1,4-benzoquinol methylase|nr:methyltransferase domain-containing protein [Acidimicrobiales bacterium]